VNAARLVLAACGSWVLLAPIVAGEPEATEPPSIQNVRLGPGDMVVRINYSGSLALYEAWLTLKRLRAQSSAEYFVPTVLAENGITRRLKDQSPAVPWATLWARLDQSGLYDFPDDKKAPACNGPVPLDAEWVTVEVARPSNYRKFSFYAPMYRDCPEARELTATLRFLQTAFRGQLPFPVESGTDQSQKRHSQ
jgi:hypothetical protein